MFRRVLPAAFFASVFALSVIAVHAQTVRIITQESGLAVATVQCTFDSQTNTLTAQVTNSSAGDITVTSVGADLHPTGNPSPSGLNGFDGSVVSQPEGAAFTFSDGELGNVPGFKRAVLDFAFLTGPNFAGGTPRIGAAPGQSVAFTVTGAAFAGFTEEQICDSVYVRFQRVQTTGRINIIKQASPESAQVFGFSGTNGIGNFSLVDDGNDNDATPNNISFDVVPGPYSITETSSGTIYSLTNLTCSVQAGGTSTFGSNIPLKLVNITLQAGDTVTCTFFNSLIPTGRIVIVQDSTPNWPFPFSFTGSGGIGTFSLEDDGDETDGALRSTYFDVPPGFYTVEQLASPADEFLTSLQCVTTTGTSSIGIPSGRTANITLFSNETVTCTYSNDLIIIL